MYVSGLKRITSIDLNDPLTHWLRPGDPNFRLDNCNFTIDNLILSNRTVTDIYLTAILESITNLGQSA